MADLTGITLGKYRLMERLGRGGMAVVYKAYHPRLDRYVAIKVLHSFLAGGEGFLERFEREARAVASLRHPNIVLVHDFDVENETFYMVMEYVEGQTLKDRIQQVSALGEYMPFEEILSLFQQVSSALDYAHSQGLIHRDIKPSNILLDKTHQAFLTDFGIAHIVSDSQFTVTGTLVGTPAYMSPEQGKGEKVTSISDIYSLGIILYQLLTGRVPYDADTPLAVIHKHVNEPLPMPRTLNPSLSAAFESVILKALAKDPADRFEHAADLTRALERAAAGQGEVVLGSAAVEVMPTVVISHEDQGSSGTVQMEAEESTRSEFGTAPLEPDFQPTEIAAPEEQMAVTEILDQPGSGAGVESHPESTPEIPQREPAEKPSMLQNQERPAGKSKLVPILVAAGIVVVVIVFALSGVFGGGRGGADDCATVEICMEMAHEVAVTDPGAAIGLMDQALSKINHDPGFAFIWCERAEMIAATGDIDLAIASAHTCLEWVGDDSDLEGVRNWAVELINHFEGR
ncbi:MAG: serine/threonine protein kinase [Anaerolineales bacterium]|nr:serine/threonine protein kinase [Anaerolineales bacterium]